MATKTVPNLPSSRHDALLEYVQKLGVAVKAQGLILHRDYCDETNAALTGTALEIIAEGTLADLPAVLVRANELKRLMNLHLASTAKHISADATNVITSADATDQGTADTLLNEIKTDLNLHQLLAGGFHDVGAVDGAIGAAAMAEATADSSTLATSKALADSLSIMFNRHVRSGLPTLELVPG